MSDSPGSSDISSLLDSDMSGSSAEAGAEQEEHQIFGKKGTFDAFYQETMASVFKQHQPTYDRLLNSRNISELKEFIQRKFNHIVWGEFLQNKLEELMDRFATEEMRQTALSFDKNPATMLTYLGHLLEIAESQMAVMMDVSFETARILEGSALDAWVQDSKEKMGEVLQRLQQQIREQQNEIRMYQDADREAREVKIELDALKKYVKEMHDRKRYDVEDAPPEEDFMAELKYRVEAEENMNSSLRDELEEERRSKEELKEQFLILEAKRVQDHQERLKEIAEKSKDIELEGGLRRELMNKMSVKK